ncbi:hypothetical protein A2W54_02680 [Candidatus Giovannonibacteria bacterium RIFCSPHIGHO2_02_43_13]|uniref:HMA domain-containing protein n=1 Tax=Candidatus Giovannonibacteria bacterium RIFCSPHIGHO2_02_43_13 TaxID=1798330 RepID=A0A1F5WSP4_9BACT|nr:MAG: Copper-translocating P-type ATPase [Parcubacteria group bacterium GW2011_GWA2_44_13]OGF73147.1 MAG: hypothetical protein A3E06_04080 [Candidatus Giovannonibacteria bacterium RIFCSPHIGHO2_12_FULL_44_42]OGF78666.1 MAG: hypothetical protein A2W54_02680 [Candidatus Giovannonibacteria bacterium RIFCSPHIGHO2_02_43_13]OGF88988.1 MAG: hypothetical protein A3I94_03725 [Candidatus Giovannonibacteria bacterium RIFCSPLOWO2_02_FULL_43_54]OGF97424.1 MAG: hypothetical protein A3H08_04075 [Candidatus G
MAIIKKKYNVEGIHCGACATGIQMLVSGEDGVKSTFVDYNTKKAEIEYDDTVINDEKVAKAVSELGYTIKPE